MDALRRIVQVLRASAGAAEHALGVTGAQLFVLRELAATPHLSINELSTRTFTHQSSVSLVVQRLVRRKLVAKAVGRHDHRRVELRLTHAGRALLRAAAPAAQEHLLQAILHLPGNDRRALAEGLKAVAEQIDPKNGRAPMLFEEQPPPPKK